jgi:hypothetical protein
MEALKTAIHILNRVPSKSVPKTPYELWTGIGKLDPKTVSCHFISYPEKLKGFRFYCPDRHTKLVEMRHAVFLEDEMMRGSVAA